MARIQLIKTTKNVSVVCVRVKSNRTDTFKGLNVSREDRLSRQVAVTRDLRPLVRASCFILDIIPESHAAPTGMADYLCCVFVPSLPMNIVFCSG